MPPKSYAPDDFQGALNVAYSRLAARMRTKAQLARALSQKGFDENTIQSVLDKLTEMGLLDDAQYARRLVEVQQYRGGRRRMEQKLFAHGIESATAKEAISGISDEDECARACVLAGQWIRGMKDMEAKARKQKLYQRLLRRGFSYETASEALKRLEGGDEFEEEFGEDI